tara:strand:- start:22612 stop:24294 length:1683 start_codon:yes stop_codon:yes gene_type:complete
MPDNKLEYESLYDEMLQNVVKEKGGSPEMYNNLLNKIGYLESGLDPSIKQLSGGPGRGKYQMETGVGYNKQYDEDGKHKVGHFKGTSNRIYYSAVRTKNYLKTLGKEIPSYISNIIDNETGDASGLSESQQDILALGDLRMGPVDLGQYASGELSGKDIYLDNWWAGKDQDHREKLSKRWDTRDQGFKDSGKYQEVSNMENNPSNQFMQQPNNIAIDNTQTQQRSIMPNMQKDNFDDFLSKRIETLKSQGSPQAQQSQPNEENEMANGGMLNEFKGGGTHEQNPMGGIPQGMGANGKPNTVEHDETSYDFPEGKFIFSNRITTDGKGSFSNTTFNQMADGGRLNECGGPGQPPCVERPMTMGKTANTVSNMASNVSKYFFDSNENSLKESPYKPTVSTEKNTKYHQRPGMREDVYKDLTSQKVKKDYNHNGSFKDIYAGLKSNGTDRKHKANESFPKNKAGYKGQYNNGHGSLTGQFNFGRYNTDAGEDEKGKYISFHDVYDWNGMKTENSINFYDRIYEDEWNDLTKQEKKKVKDSFEKLKSFDKKSKNKKSYEYFKKK